MGSPAFGLSAPPVPVRPGVAVYLRVSTTEQDLGGQERELHAEAERRGWDVREVFAEKVSATGAVERPEYDRLMQEISGPRTWSHLLVWSLDRFSRAQEFYRAVEDVFEVERHGVRFHSLKEPAIDTPEDGLPSMNREILLALLPVLAKWEARRRAERTQLAMDEIRAGRRRTRTGNPVGRKRKVTPELEQRIRELRAQGLQWSAIAQRVGLPAGTCRKVKVPLPSARPRVENPVPEFRAPSDGPKDLPG